MQSTKTMNWNKSANVPHIIARCGETTSPGIETIGAKALGLANLQVAGVSVPSWFAVTPEAFHRSLGVDSQSIANLSPAQLSALVANMNVDPSITFEIKRQARELFGDKALVAVRSSAVEEDGEALSFAGQFDSFLNVSHDDIAERVVQVWKSCFSKRVLAYRQLHGLTDLPKAPAVLIQAMVPALRAGVCFTADPVSGNDEHVILCAVRGLADKLVSGEVDGETIVATRKGDILFASDARTGISADEVRLIVQLAIKIESHYKCPQDLEWAIDETGAHFVQARPITTIKAIGHHQLEDDDKTRSHTGTLSIWDNSNIGESYQGVTTPLTFSFARKAYEHVYIEFCRLMSVPEDQIERNRNIFPCMLGFIAGRIYYNLSNWYRLLAMLPGYGVNRRFMEQMMGVKEGIPDEVLGSIETPRSNKVAFTRSIIKLVWNLQSMPNSIRTFNQYFERCMKEIPSDLDALSAQQVGRIYRRLESQLLTKWDAPLVNDFYAMVFFGLLKAICKKWLGDNDESWQNQLVSSTGEIISAEPARLMRAMARMASESESFVHVLQRGSLPAILTEMERHPSFKASYSGYLDKFGDRCVNELKLESATVCDDPLLLLRSVGSLAGRRASDLSDDVLQGKEARKQAELRAYELLRGNPVKTLVFDFVLKQARERLRDRENLRFQRTRLFGKVRALFRAVGKKLCAMRVLNDEKDIFYLEVNEVLAFLEGTSSSARLADLVELRKQELRSCHLENMPGRLTTRGIVYVDFAPVSKSGRVSSKTVLSGQADTPAADTLKGTGCCAGRVKGRARVVRDPRETELNAGEILVCERTDPGWILLFSQAAGILVEHGSLVSHTAIVSRELGIPAVVSIPGLMSWIKDGDMIEFDGTSGLISLSLDRPMQSTNPEQGAERSA